MLRRSGKHNSNGRVILKRQTCVDKSMRIAHTFRDWLKLFHGKYAKRARQSDHYRYLFMVLDAKLTPGGKSIKKKPLVRYQ